jgi:hypothetical protein
MCCHGLKADERVIGCHGSPAKQTPCYQPAAWIEASSATELNLSHGSNLVHESNFALFLE